MNPKRPEPNKKFSGGKKPSNQIIFSKADDKFLIGKRFPRSIAVISPFEKVDDTFTSNFRAPNNRSRRVQILYNMIPKISEYSVSEGGVQFDCIKSISDNTDIFANLGNTVKNGYIHFDVTSYKEKVKDSKDSQTVIDVNPRLVFTKLYDQEMTEGIIDGLSHKFKTSKFKAFSVILEKGFILCSVDKYLTQLYVTITSPKSMFIGNCVKYEISNITNNIFPLWPIFNINMNQSKLGLYMNNDILKDYADVDQPILVKLEREIDSNEVFTKCLGMHVRLDQKK